MIMFLRSALIVALSALAHAEVVFDDDMAELAKILRENCAAETGVDVTLIDKINAGAALTEDAKLKCYMKCTMEAAGALSDGVVDVEAVIAVLPDGLRERIEAGLRACGTKRGADDCDTAYNTQLCWQQSSKKDFFMI